MGLGTQQAYGPRSQTLRQQMQAGFKTGHIMQSSGLASWPRILKQAPPPARYGRQGARQPTLVSPSPYSYWCKSCVREFGAASFPNRQVKAARSSKLCHNHCSRGQKQVLGGVKRSGSNFQVPQKESCVRALIAAKPLGDDGCSFDKLRISATAVAHSLGSSEAAQTSGCRRSHFACSDLARKRMARSISCEASQKINGRR